MSQEITATVALSVSNGNLSRTMLAEAEQRPDMAGSRAFSSQQDIGTGAPELLVFPSDQTTARWGYFKNLDATNYVSIGPNNGTPYFLRLYPGMACVVSLDNATIYARADTGAVKLECGVIEP